MDAPLLDAQRDPVDLAVRALRDRDRSRHELEERLARAGIGAAEREETLATLERIGYVDDGRFALARAQALVERGYGDAAVRHDLVRHGVGHGELESALAAIPPEADRAVELAERLGRTAAAARRLARKGFGREALESAFGPGIAPDGPSGLE